MYPLAPAVWWTTASLIADANAGVLRLIFSSAFQPLRGTIAGEPAFWSVRAGTPAGGLQTK